MSTERGRPLPYLVANSAYSFFPGPERYSLKETIDYAQYVGADGTQLHTSQLNEGFGPVEVFNRLEHAGLKTNVVHLGGVLSSESFGREGESMLRDAVQMVKPIPDVGIVCIIHNNGGTTESVDSIAAMTKKVLSRVDDDRIVLGFEFVPHRYIGELSAQVDKHLEVSRALVAAGVPVMPVIDARSLHDMSDGKQFEDPDDYNLDKLCAAAANGKALIQIRDVRDIPTSYQEGNFVIPGTGKFGGLYQRLFALGKHYDIEWLGMIDENQEPILRYGDIDKTYKQLGLAHS